MTSRVLIFDQAGKPLAEIDTNVTRSWVLHRGEGSDIGRGEFEIAKSDPKATEKNLQYGNFVVVEHDVLPIWVGVIDTPRRWTSTGIITISLYAAEKVLEWRRGEGQLKVTATPGGLYREIIKRANAAGQIAIVPGEIYEGNSSIAELINLSDLLNETKRIASLTACEWDFTPAVDDKGVLVLKANFYQRMGVDRMNALEEWNTEAADQLLVEQGDIVNDLLGYNQAASWDSKGSYKASDSVSVGKYGLRQAAKGFDVDKRLGTLEQQTRNSLTGEPRRTFRLVALNEGDTWNNLRLGDTLPLVRTDVGWSGVSTRVRILGMALTDSAGKVNLTVDEVN